LASFYVAVYNNIIFHLIEKSFIELIVMKDQAQCPGTYAMGAVHDPVKGSYGYHMTDRETTSKTSSTFPVAAAGQRLPPAPGCFSVFTTVNVVYTGSQCSASQGIIHKEQG
jgi:hypothetical protein